MSIAKAAATGDRRKTLEALRDRLALAADEAADAVVAQVAGRLSAVLVELENLPQKEMSASDELAERRANRRSKAPVDAPAAKQGKQQRKRSS